MPKIATRVHTAAVFARYTYDAALIPVHGTPLYDRKQAKPVHASSTVRLNKKFLQPKQLVYILAHPRARPTDTNPDPTLTLPPYILCRDGDESNLDAANLYASDHSRRWHSILLTTEGAPVLLHNGVRNAMTEEDMVRMGFKTPK